MIVRVLISLALLCYLPCANAFQLVPQAKACNLYFKSAAVFVGKVISTTPYTGNSDGWSYKLKVIKSFRGKLGPTVIVRTEASSGELGLNDGFTYLLFAYRDNGGPLFIVSDGVSGQLIYPKREISKLEGIVAASHRNGGGEIYGRIVTPDQFPEGLAGVHVLVSGSGKTYSLVSGEAGWFHVHVPAGSYSATAAHSGWLFKPLELSQDNPKRFRVANGGCAQIEIVADRVTNGNSK